MADVPAAPDLRSSSSARPTVAAEVGDLLLTATRRVRRAAGEALQPLGITPGQARAVRVLMRSDRPLRMGDLAERLRIVPRSATSVVDDLEAAGLVRRGPDPDDRRAVVVSLTAAGESTAQDLVASRRHAAAEVTAALSDTELATLRDLLRRLDG